MLRTDIDREIELKQEELERLKQERAAQEQKMKGVQDFRDSISKVCNEYGLSRDELFTGLGDDIVDWVKSLNKQQDRPEVYNELKSYFARVLAREGNTRKPAAKSGGSRGPKLAVGTYRNPNTGETVEKIKRNPKTLDQWLNEHGVETVRTWKV